MKENDKPRFAAAMNSLGVAFSKTLSDPDLDVWWSLVGDLPIEDFERAARLHARQGLHFPRPAELFALAGLPAIAPPSLDDEAEIAAGKAFGAIRDVGMYRSVVFDDPVIHLVIEAMGGWGDFCRAPDTTSRRVNFARQYVAQRKRVQQLGIERIQIPRQCKGDHGETRAIPVGDRERILAWREKAAPLQITNGGGSR